MDWFGEIIVARVSYPGQQIYTVILGVLSKGIWSHHNVISRKTTTVASGSFQRYNIILQNSKVNFQMLT